MMSDLFRVPSSEESGSIYRCFLRRTPRGNLVFACLRAHVGHIRGNVRIDEFDRTAGFEFYPGLVAGTG